VTHTYDWSKLDAGWSVEGDILRHSGADVHGTPWFVDWSISVLETVALDDSGPDNAPYQLAKCRVVDNTPLFEAMDQMSAEVPPEEWAKLEREPSQPWRRGPLASWTLVNISNHDGRLTVVMKRGRSELVMETGPDDEVLWERLGKKVVEFDRAKAATK
jgi:hypothetical protein